MANLEIMDYDVVIVGAGPSGLAAAIRLKQVAPEFSVAVIDKAPEVGAHTLSGAVLEPTALNELLPDWRERNAPITTQVTQDAFVLLTKKHSFRLPTPPQMVNHGNYIVSLGQVVRWLAKQAEQLGVEIYPGFAAVDYLTDPDGAVIGIRTGELGVAKSGEPKGTFQPGIGLRAKVTIFAEGCRGSLSERLQKAFDLRRDANPQTYAIGLKELWEVPAAKPGKVVHTIGWPLDARTYGGSFLYHLNETTIAIGYVVALDYRNPHLSPYREFQRFKHHPRIAPELKGGRRISYGARALNEGGWQSIPKLTFPGGVLVGCAAGFLNVAKIKGTHTAMKSGMLAADAIADSLKVDSSTFGRHVHAYPQQLRQSWIATELYGVRNVRPAFRWGLWLGLLYNAVETFVLRKWAKWTLSHHADHTQLAPAKTYPPIAYPKADGVLSFDRLSNLAFANIRHDADQPVHLKLKNPQVAIGVNLPTFAGPEQVYCPAGVYEYVADKNGEQQLVINAQNCVHCKTCDIKDPTQNIVWVPPEGGSGPYYEMM